MNPCDWELRHRVALAVSASLGAMISLVVGYLSAETSRTPTDWLFDFGYSRFRLPDAASWLLIGIVLGGGLYYVWRISALPLPPPKVGDGVKRVVADSWVVSFLWLALREMLALASFLLVFAVVCLPLVLFQRSIERGNFDALPFDVVAQDTPLLVAAMAALTGLLGLALGRWAYSRVRAKPTQTEAEDSRRIMPKWLELAFSVAVAGLILASLAIATSN